MKKRKQNEIKCKYLGKKKSFHSPEWRSNVPSLPYPAKRRAGVLSYEWLQTEPRDTCETESKSRHLLYSVPAAQGIAPPSTHTPQAHGRLQYMVTFYVYSLFSLEKGWLCKLFFGTRYCH